eukprot:CAMPEP_0204379234 /NCGR_PEP_ID=MMETSP0469-20131031/52437_1 /ASSEMBLY_ACC=CAM_ASM_000384 /TAXON_ID=2969 /ORGANISM="Oxyrrhis marina" /LENGTH=101 /DNA_ID=CAMNT_0051370683 /DNA_START=18 /DNA_END=319 /DNA_ORIENTATION=-
MRPCGMRPNLSAKRQRQMSWVPARVDPGEPPQAARLGGCLILCAGFQDSRSPQDHSGPQRQATDVTTNQDIQDAVRSCIAINTAEQAAGFKRPKNACGRHL